MNRAPENTPESDRDSGSGEKNLSPIARAIKSFYEDTIPTAERLEIDCKMKWLDKPTEEHAGGRLLHEYKTTFSEMRGILNGEPSKFAWIEPEKMKVKVYYVTDGGPMWDEPTINLKIVGGEICLENRLIDRRWNHFILVGLRFYEGEIKYKPHNFTEQKAVQQIYKTHFVFEHSCVNIWGKDDSNGQNPEFVDREV